MQHCTPEQLALAALGEPLPQEDDDHLAACDRCRAEVASLRRSVEVLAVPELAGPAAPVPPPPSVWREIAGATGVSAVPAGLATPPEVAPAEGGSVVPLGRTPRRRSWRTRVLLVAASLVIGIGVGAGAVALAHRATDTGQTVATAPLRAIDVPNASGTATVVRQRDAEVLQVDLSAPPPSAGYYEVWLATPDLQHMVPMGILHDGKGSMNVPAGVDIASYQVVDVSVQEIGGSPEHSDVSVARGQLAR